MNALTELVDPLDTVLQTAVIYQALADTCALIEGVAVVHGANMGTPESPIVRPLTDSLAGTPAILLVPGPWENIAGGAARVNHTCQGAILVERNQDPGTAAFLLMRIFDSLIATFAEHGKAQNPTDVLQVANVTSGPGLSFSEWPVDSNAIYLSWPFEIEFRVNPNALRYRPG